MLNLLSATVTDPASRVRIVLTLRADFMDWPLQNPVFGELMRPGLELVLPLSAEEVGRVVVGPAARVGVRVEDDGRDRGRCQRGARRAADAAICL